MEWNTKHPLQWEWENLVTSGPKATDNMKVWQPSEWGIEAEEGMDSGSLYSYRGGSASGGSSGGTSFDPGYTCLSKSSKSPSMNSSSTEEMKFPKFSVEACKGYPEDFSCKRDIATAELCGASPTLESSVCSGEPLLSLKLGKRTYFEDISDGSNPRASNFPLVAKSPDASAKKMKSTSQNMPAPCCQVEGCNIDLSSAKDYHRKHRVCESHSKSPKVVVNGVERRFCQQCSRFHGLSEFDENKRSCRKRLSDHNARRRKPHPDVAHFNQSRLSTIIYGSLQQMNSIYSGVPFEHTKSSVNLTWSNPSTLKFMQTKGDALKPGKAGDVEGNPRHSSEESLISSSGLDAPQDLHRALSLLSTDSRDSCKQSKPALHDMNNVNIPKPCTYGVPQSLGLPLSSTKYWNMEQWLSNTQRHDLTPQSGGNGSSFGNSNFSECLLPSEGQHLFGFEPVHLN
ncbi:hypothetical protein CRG98_037329 [Punica granatum]|uniref:SBP-type domain-containing protein n=1 Tax=Punica granatum TaxID=22663 RepID=A0A2I0IE55_PUNGR|nr:hypothetical protein CRG98_037329 [Punica granatum]